MFREPVQAVPRSCAGDSCARHAGGPQTRSPPRGAERRDYLVGQPSTAQRYRGDQHQPVNLVRVPPGDELGDLCCRGSGRPTITGPSIPPTTSPASSASESSVVPSASAIDPLRLPNPGQVRSARRRPHPRATSTRPSHTDAIVQEAVDQQERGPAPGVVISPPSESSPTVTIRPCRWVSSRWHAHRAVRARCEPSESTSSSGSGVLKMLSTRVYSPASRPNTPIAPMSMRPLGR